MNGATCFVGREAVEIFRLGALIQALRLEEMGIRLSRNVRALKVAKTITGLKTNDRAKHIQKLQVMMDALKSAVPVVNDRTP